MRTARMKLPEGQEAGFYHCVSRVIDRKPIFDDAGRDQFVALMRESEAFHEVRVLTFCVMADHFHILLEVPKRRPADELPNAEVILTKLEKLSGHQSLELVRERFELYRKTGDVEGEAAYLATFHERLRNLGAFMKLLKMRFTTWYNPRAGRKGTLWEERFKSVLVEGVGEAPMTMAAYIDLNPVRAGLVVDPKDYPWCGYAEAMAGDPRSKSAVQALVTALQHGQEESANRSLEIYGTWLSAGGAVKTAEGATEGAEGERSEVKREEALKVLEGKGRLPLAEYLRCRVRYFSDGAVFGSREFVDRVFEAHRPTMSAKRKTGARKMQGLADRKLYTLRQLRLDVFS